MNLINIPDTSLSYCDPNLGQVALHKKWTENGQKEGRRLGNEWPNLQVQNLVLCASQNRDRDHLGFKSSLYITLNVPPLLLFRKHAYILISVAQQQNSRSAPYWSVSNNHCRWYINHSTPINSRPSFSMITCMCRSYIHMYLLMEATGCINLSSQRSGTFVIAFTPCVGSIVTHRLLRFCWQLSDDGTRLCVGTIELENNIAVIMTPD